MPTGAKGGPISGGGGPKAPGGWIFGNQTNSPASPWVPGPPSGTGSPPEKVYRKRPPPGRRGTTPYKNPSRTRPPAGSPPPFRWEPKGSAPRAPWKEIQRPIKPAGPSKIVKGLKGLGQLFRGLILVDIVQHWIELENLLLPTELVYRSLREPPSANWIPLPPAPPFEIEETPNDYIPGEQDLGVLYGESKWVLCLYGGRQQRNNSFYGKKLEGHVIDSKVTLLKEELLPSEFLYYIWLKGPISSIGLLINSSETKYGQNLHRQYITHRPIVYCYGRDTPRKEPAQNPPPFWMIGRQRFGLGTAYEKETEFAPDYWVYSNTETVVDQSKLVSSGQIIMTNRPLGEATTTYKFTTGGHFLLPLRTEDGTSLLHNLPGTINFREGKKEDMTCPDIRPQLAVYQKNVEAALAAQTQLLQSKLDQNVLLTSTSVNSQLSNHQSQLLDGFNQLKSALTGSFNSFQSSVLTSFSQFQSQLSSAFGQGTTSISQSLEGVLSKLEQIQGTLEEFFAKFKKFLKWSLIDRVLNVLTFIMALHNAYMLSNSLAQTLLSAVSNLLTAAGNLLGLRDVEDSPIDVGEILGDTFENIAKALLGAETLEGLKKEWQRYNRIYQAAANLLNSLQSIYYSIVNILEVLGGWVAKIGNALQRWGVVGERAFGWMNPNPDFDNRFFRALETTEAVVSQVDSIASEILSTQQTFSELTKQKEELQQAVSAAGETEGAKQAADKEASKAPTIEKSDLVKPAD